MFAFFLFLSRKFRFARRRLGVRVSEFNPLNNANIETTWYMSNISAVIPILFRPT